MPIARAATLTVLLGATPAFHAAGQVDYTGISDGFMETFEGPDWYEQWYLSNYEREGTFATAWRRELVELSHLDEDAEQESAVLLRLRPGSEADEKPYKGAEVQKPGRYHYGTYEVVMQPGRGDGLVSAMFTYTGPHFDAPHDEIDFEFLGRDTKRVWLNVFTQGESLPGRWIDLGFDAAEEPRLYRFKWRPTSITWYVDDRELLHVTSDEHPIPSEPGKIFLQIWAGNEKMTEWLGAPSTDLTANAKVYCVSYRPFHDDGRSCSDHIAEIHD